MEDLKILTAASSRRNIKIRVPAPSLLEDVPGGTPSAISKDEQGIPRSGRTVMTSDDWNAPPLLDQAELDCAMAFIAELFTNPDHRRQGLAEELLHRCMQALHSTVRTTVAVSIDSSGHGPLPLQRLALPHRRQRRRQRMNKPGRPAGPVSELAAAIESVQQTALAERGCGILITRSGAGTVSLSDAVHFGLTGERDAG